MSYNPSRELFQDRLAALVIRDGIEGTAGFYGVQPQTVARWLRGTQAPRARTRRSVTSRGIRLTGPSQTVRNPETGLFETAIISGSAVKAINTINARRKEARQAALEAATNPGMVAMAESIKPLTQDEMTELDLRLRRLNQQTALFGESENEDVQAGLEFDWRRFDRDYNRLGQGQQIFDEEQEMRDTTEEIESIRVVNQRIRYRRNAYVVIRGRAKDVFIGKRGGFYYRSPAGRKVYVNRGRVFAADRVVSE